MSDITPETLLDAQLTSADDDISLLERLLRSLNSFFSQEDIDQKTILKEPNIIGITQLEAYNEYLQKHHGINDRIAQNLIERRRINNKSLEGLGLQYMISFVKAFSTRNETTVNETEEKIKALGGVK